MTRTYPQGLHRYALVTAGATLLLLVAGGLVTSHDAGLSVPDWPLSYGSVMPPMSGNVFYEHGHRVVATLVGMLTIGLAVWLARADERLWMRRLGWFALALVIAQGVLGGITVKMQLPKAVSVAHATTAQVFFCVTLALALFTSRWWRDAEEQAVEDDGAPRLRTLATVTFGATLVQLVLGASFRHKALSIIPHVAWAFAVTFLLAWTILTVRWRFETVRPLRRAATAIAALLAVQLVLGVAAYWARTEVNETGRPVAAMVALTVTHLAVGALTLGGTALLGLLAYRLTAPAAAAAGPVAALKPGTLKGSAL
jgi:cytochrome c oxidase assembly protein subunit 15